VGSSTPGGTKPIQFVFYVLHQCLQLTDRDGTLLTGVAHAGLDLLAFEWLTPAVALDDHELVQYDALNRAKTLEAALTAAAAVDRAALVTRVGDARFDVATVGTFH